jgi:hypothetical protein
VATMTKFDDAIAEARRRIASIPAAITARAAEARTLEARLATLDIADAVGDPIPAGEPSRSTAALETVRAEGRTLEAERDRLQLRVDALLVRRQAAVVELVNAERGELAARWGILAGQAIDAATRLHAIVLELEPIEEAYRAAGAGSGLPSGGIPTVDDVRLNPVLLERSIVHVARGLALRAG